MWFTVFILIVLFIFIYIRKQLHDTRPNKFKFYFKYFIYYFWTILISAFIWPYFLLSPKNLNNLRNGVWLVKHVTKVCDLKWQLRDGNILAEDRGAVIVSNHQSSFDILGLANIWEVAYKMTVIAKKQLFYIWPFGLSGYLGGLIFIDRSNSKGAYKQLEVSSNIMTKEKAKIWFFPEGTRNKDHTRLLPFKKGAFNLAVAAQVPIIPVVFSPYYFINKEKYIFNKGQIIIQCLEPVPTAGLTMDNVPDLIQKIHQMMTVTYKKLSQEVFSSLPPDYSQSTQKAKVYPARVGG